MLVIAIVLLRKENINILSNKTKMSFVLLKEWFKVGKFSGLESFLRNLAFMVMIVRIVNEVEEQGSYWVANNYIWGCLLLPVLALGDLAKKEIGEDENNIITKTFGYFSVVSVIEDRYRYSFTDTITIIPDPFIIWGGEMMKNKKRLLKFGLKLFISLFLIFVLFIIYQIFYVKPITSNDLNDYTSKKYINFNGGKLATKFLPEYEELSDYETIEFHYFDGTQKFSLYKLGVTFTLDVKYDESIYLEKKKDLNAKYSFNNPKMCYYGWSCHPISEGTNDFTDYSKYFAVIYTNDEKNLIRYVYYFEYKYNDGLYNDYSFDYRHIRW